MCNFCAHSFCSACIIDKKCIMCMDETMQKKRKKYDGEEDSTDADLAEGDDSEDEGW